MSVYKRSYLCICIRYLRFRCYEIGVSNIFRGSHFADKVRRIKAATCVWEHARQLSSLSLGLILFILSESGVKQKRIRSV